MEETKSNKNGILVGCIFFIVVATDVLAGFLFGCSKQIILRNAIISGIMSLGLVFVLSDAIDSSKLVYNNMESKWKFHVYFYACMVISYFCPLLPVSGWPFLLIFIVLSLFSNETVGTVASLLLLVNSTMLCSDATVLNFVCYAAPGIVAVVLFSSLDEQFKISVPLGSSAGFSFVSLCIVEVLCSNNKLSWSLFVIPAINVGISTIALLIIIKLFSFNFVYKTSDRYMDILDPEFELLAKLKSYSKEEYNHTIYTAVLCSKMALKMGLNENVTKALGYYHKIGILKGANNVENVELLLNEYEIPEEVISLLREYVDDKTQIHARENAVLLFADTVISSVSYLFAKDANIKIDYDKLINGIFDKKLESGVLSNSAVSFEDINNMKKVLIGEKLFYDFLR